MKAPYYVFPGLKSMVVDIVTRNYGLNSEELWKGQQRPKVEARDTIFLLERIKGQTEQVIADKYAIKRNTIHASLVRCRERLDTYPAELRRFAQLATQLELKTEFQNYINQ